MTHRGRSHLWGGRGRGQRHYWTLCVQARLHKGLNGWRSPTLRGVNGAGVDVLGLFSGVDEGLLCDEYRLAEDNRNAGSGENLADGAGGAVVWGVGFVAVWWRVF